MTPDYKIGSLVKTKEYYLFMAEKPDGIFADFKNDLVRCVHKKETEPPFDLKFLTRMLDQSIIQWECKAWLIEPNTPMFVVKWHNGGELLKILVGERLGYVASYKWLEIEKIEI